MNLEYFAIDSQVCYPLDFYVKVLVSSIPIILLLFTTKKGYSDYLNGLTTKDVKKAMLDQR